MKKIALITSIFDYPEHYLPTFYNNALKYFKSDDIHIVRNVGLIPKDDSLYVKLHYYKIIKLHEYIRENILEKYEYILFMDAFDTTFIKDVDDFIGNLNNLSMSIVMGGEKNLWPFTDFNNLYDNKRAVSEYKYLNSGTYFGYTDKIYQHLCSIIDRNYNNGIDDQGHWTIEYLLSNDIIIDQECNFFFSTFKSKDKLIYEKENIKLNNINASIVHDNGGFTDDTIKLVNYFNI